MDRANALGGYTMPAPRLRLVSLLLVGACLDPTGPQRAEDASILEYETNAITIVRPDTVEIGARFDVNITTYGRGCDQQGNDYLSMPNDSTVFIQPSDLFLLTGESCDESLQRFDHVVNLLAARLGALQVRVDGLALHGTAVTSVSSVGFVFVR
jgi:hypothetical protein